MGRAPMSKTKRLRIFNRTGGRCAYCGRKLELDKPWHVDHLYPHSWGGGSRDTNLIPACCSCNIRKKDRDVDTFREWVMNGLAEAVESLVTDRLTKCDAYLVDDGANEEITEKLYDLYYAIRRQRVRFFFEKD